MSVALSAAAANCSRDDGKELFDRVRKSYLVAPAEPFQQRTQYLTESLSNKLPPAWAACRR